MSATPRTFARTAPLLVTTRAPSTEHVATDPRRPVGRGGPSRMAEQGAASVLRENGQCGYYCASRDFHPCSNCSSVPPVALTRCQMQWFRCLLALALVAGTSLPSMAQQPRTLTPGENLVAEGLPPIPASLV